MTDDKASSILETYNKWRRGAKIEPPHPRLVGIAIDHVVKKLKRKSMIIAIDFDGTIVFEDHPKIGTLLPYAKEVINKLYAAGHYIIIWSCRTGKEARDAVDFLNDEGLRFHAFNEGHPANIAKYGDTGRKIYYDILIDDKALGFVSDWHQIEKQVETRLEMFDYEYSFLTQRI
jgi:hypothetical protein